MLNMHISNNAHWKINVSELIIKRIKSYIATKNKCTIFLTGGRSAASIYPYLKMELSSIEGEINFFLGDERCVPETHEDSNYRMILETLFPSGFSSGQKLYKMFDENDSAEEAAWKYEKLITDKPDILLLGLGDDGHIASLFPGSNWQEKNSKKVVQVISPYNGMKRITITRHVIEDASEIIVLAAGSKKSQVVKDLFSSDPCIKDYPAVLAKNGIWLLDESAAAELNTNNIHIKSDLNI